MPNALFGVVPVMLRNNPAHLKHATCITEEDYAIVIPPKTFYPFKTSRGKLSITVSPWRKTNMSERNTDKDWDVTVIKIADLKEFEANPRQINKKDFADLVKSIKEDGYHDLVKVNHEYKMIGGHQRRKALLAAGYMPHNTIQVRIPKRVLTDDEFRRINIRSNIHNGKWDFDVLANEWEISELIDSGFDMSCFPDIIDKEEVKEEALAEAVFKEYCPTCGHEMKETNG